MPPPFHLYKYVAYLLVIIAAIYFFSLEYFNKHFIFVSTLHIYLFIATNPIPTIVHSSPRFNCFGIERAHA